LFNLPGTVLIDDKEDELYEILNSIAAAGIPCIPIHYKNEPGNQSGIDHIDLENVKPRIIITDLNLTETGSLNAKSLVGPIAKVLEPLTAYGPYILLFWSRNEDIVGEVVKELKVRFHNKINLPIHWDVISKSQFKDKPKDLKDKIESLIKTNSLFNAISDWESRITHAAQKTSNALYELTKPTVYEPENKTDKHQEQFIKALALIGNETVGIKNALEHPSLAVDLGLSPLLQDQLNISNLDENLWGSAIPLLGKGQTLDDDIKSTLNTYCHLEQVDPDFPKNCRGVFVKINNEILNTPAKRHKLEDRIGNTIEDLIHEEFLSQSKCGKTKPEAKAFQKEARESIKLGFVEVSAVCDQAQQKTKLHQYLLAALIPEKFEELTNFKNSKGEIQNFSHIGIYRLPKIKIDDEIYILKLTFKYQIGTRALSKVKERTYQNTWFGKPLFRLKDQILSDISFKSAQYSSRPGIIRFD
jgi:hypothetical protein